jgi:glycolate oxidase
MGTVPIRQIVAIVGSQYVNSSLEERYCYSYDASKLQAVPDCVAFPGSAAEIAALLKLANREAFPVFPRGAGSGMVGASVPWAGGLVIALNRLNRILRIDTDNMIAVVEPAVVTATLQKAVAQFGLFYPPDPASLQFSTLGGNVAMGSGGPRALKYGVTRDYVMGMEVVMPQGDIIHTGGHTMKNAVGYDLTRLMVGSEGTLGVFTQIILRLLPQPEAIRTLLAVFPVLEDATRAVANIIRNRIIPCTLEFMDQATIQAVENYLHAGLPVDAEAVLLIELDGPESILDHDLSSIRDICYAQGASVTETADSEAERERLWHARRSVSPALGQIRPGKINEDIAVPRMQIPALLKTIRGLAAKYRLCIVSFGHAGDGNIHMNIMFDPKDNDECKRAEQAAAELFRGVLELGGTISGEHGIGIAKSPFFHLEVGRPGWEAMWRIKQALDPLNILNPGKMFVSNRAFFQNR